jgi:hypothetical protein
MAEPVMRRFARRAPGLHLIFDLPQPRLASAIILDRDELLDAVTALAQGKDPEFVAKLVAM